MSVREPLLRREDCVLVVIDAQEKLMPVIAGREAITDNLLRLVKFAGIIGLPVLASEQQKLGPTLEPIAAELPDFRPVEKITFDCLACQPFRERLAALDRGTLLLAGVEAHICVAQTALNAAGRYRVQVVGDAAGSRAPANRDLAWERLRMSGVTITSTEMLIYELLGQASTPEFKATLPLVK
jgi:nicotinamidase-related amidase